MSLFSYFRVFIALTAVHLPLTRAQLIDNLPQCVQDCIEQSPDTNCALTDIGCICRASAGNFLPDVVTCVHGNCDNDLDTNLLLTPLQFACMIAGSPIPASAIRNAENQASSLATQVTTTVTMGGISVSGGASATTTVYAPSLSVSTVTVTTTQSGSTFYQVFPITVGSTMTASGPTSTLTSILSTSALDTSVGSSTTSSKNSEGSTESTSFTTTSVAAGYTSSSETASSKTANAPNPDSTNSSPFKNTNTAVRRSIGSWLGFGVLLAMLCVWI